VAAPVAPAIIVLVVPAAALLATAPPAPEPRWRPPPGSLIRDIVARHYGITRAEIQGGSHRAVYVLPRHVAMYLCVRLGGLSLPLTGRLFGNRDHTTVLHAVKRITDRSAESAALAAEVKTLWERCEAA
jgi:chromosomal replication initiator protein